MSSGIFFASSFDPSGARSAAKMLGPEQGARSGSMALSRQKDREIVFSKEAGGIGDWLPGVGFSGMLQNRSIDSPAERQRARPPAMDIEDPRSGGSRG